MKKIKNLVGARKLNKKEQVSIKGSGFQILNCVSATQCTVRYNGEIFIVPGRCLYDIYAVCIAGPPR